MRFGVAVLSCSVLACGSGEVDKRVKLASTTLVELSARGGDAVVDDGVVEVVRKRRGVLQVEPRLALAFPARGSFSIGGKQLHVEVICDGIDPALVAGEVPAFVDCDRRDATCDRAVPILVHPTLVEIYNLQYAPEHELPAVDVDALDAAALAKLQIEISMGESFVSGPPSSPEKVFPVVGTVVGIHERAMTVGMTVPIQYVRRWNARMTGSESPRGYATVRITLEQGELAALRKWAESIGLQASVVSPDGTD